MKKILIFLAIQCLFSTASAQFVHKIKADSVLITNDSCTAELNLENSTKHIKGFLYNKGNGRTEFRKADALNDSTLVFGEDTLVIRGSSGNAWKLAGNAGTNPVNHFLETTDNPPLIMRTNDTERFRITPGGNVGIGTNTPGSLLHIRNTASCCGAVLLESNFEALSIRLNLASSFPGMRMYNQNGNTYGAFSGRNSDKQVFKVADSGDIAFWTGNPTVQGMVIGANGNTGIGTFVPSYRLQVNGSMGVNKDSIPKVDAVTTQHISLIDTTTRQVKRIGETDINPVLLSGVIWNNNAGINLTPFVSKGYDRIIIEIEATPGIQEDSLHMRFSENGGAFFITANDHNWTIVQYNDNGSQAFIRNSSDSKFTLARAVDGNQEGENSYVGALLRSCIHSKMNMM